MDRREFLAGSATGVVGAVAGCMGWSVTGKGPGRTRAETTSSRQGVDSDNDTVSSIAGVDLPIPKSELARGAPRDAIPAIIDPVFAEDWSGIELVVTVQLGQKKVRIEPRLNPDDRVVGIVREGVARAYPLRVLNWHEVVNDNFGGPLLVTYCPLCGSAVTAARRVNGETTVFGVSGLLWNSNLVMYDELTGSLWSQVAATAINGPETGKRLSLTPSTLTTWETWRRNHPETKVLLPPPKSNTVEGIATRNYNVNPYAAYENETRIGVGKNDLPESDVKLHPKIQVLGISSGGVQKAYPLPAVQASGVVNDTVGSLPVVITVAADDVTLLGYVRRVHGVKLHFEKSSSTHLRADGSRWKISTGRAVDGPHEGNTLPSAAQKPQMYWFAWRDLHPNTRVYTGKTERLGK